ncbi:MAG: hypothetical protein AAGJ19_01725 [Myxococcota bacterium]
MTVNGDWWAWRALYQGEADIFEPNVTLFETSPPSWGGTARVAVNEPHAALALLYADGLGLPSVYLHSSGASLYTPEVSGAFVRS